MSLIDQSLKDQLTKLVELKDKLKKILKDDKLVNRTDIDWNEKNLFNDLVPLVEEIESGLDTSDATAIPEHILEGETAYLKNGKQVGMLKDYGKDLQTRPGEKFSFTPGAVRIEIPTKDRFVSRNIVIETDPYLIPENIKDGITIFGVEGTAEINGTDTSDGNITALDVVKDKIGYAQGQKIIGQLGEYKGEVENKIELIDDFKNKILNVEMIPTTEDVKLLTGGTKVNSNIIIKGDSNLLPENILKGKTIFGVPGTLIKKDTDDSEECTATENSIMLNRTAVVDNSLITGKLDLSLLTSLSNGSNGGVI